MPKLHYCKKRKTDWLNLFAVAALNRKLIRNAKHLIKEVFTDRALLPLQRHMSLTRVLLKNPDSLVYHFTVSSPFNLGSDISGSTLRQQ